jgi:hypothetical protein
MELSIIGIIISGIATGAVGLFAFLSRIKKANFCCCKSECQRTTEEIEADRQVEIIQSIENEHIKNVQSLFNIIKSTESPQLKRKDKETFI